MTIEEIIKKYKISKFYDGMIRVDYADLAKRDNVFYEIKIRKPEIIEYFNKKEAEEKAKFDARMKKIEAIEGLKELQEVILAWEDYREEFSRRMESEYMSSILPTKPAVTVEEISQKYPRAAAYIKAEQMSMAANYYKAGCGSEALEKIINGYDYDKAITEAESKWSEYCMEHMFD